MLNQVQKIVTKLFKIDKIIAGYEWRIKTATCALKSEKKVHVTMDRLIRDHNLYETLYKTKPTKLVVCRVTISELMKDTEILEHLTTRFDDCTVPTYIRLILGVEIEFANNIIGWYYA